MEKQNGDLRWIRKNSRFVDRNGEPTHMARQLSSGLWASKLGIAWKDVEHVKLSSMEGKDYGKVVKYLRRGGSRHQRCQHHYVR